MRKLIFLLILGIGFYVATTKIGATYNSCNWVYTNHHWVYVCSTPSPTPTSTVTPTPTPTPEPCVDDNPNDGWELVAEWNDGEKTECGTPEPTVTPVPTPQPYHQPDAAHAPTLPLCPYIEGWYPQVTYNGFTKDLDGNYVFHYVAKAVEEKKPSWWVKWGFTADFLPFEKVFKNNEPIDITMYGGNTNWINVAQYKEPGCFGLWSGAIN